MDAEVDGVCVADPVTFAVVELLGVFVGVAVLVLGPEEVPVTCAVLEAVILAVTGFEGAAEGVELVVAAAEPDFVWDPVAV
jgi:hypothetical protein